MGTLADAIERYIKELFQETALDYVELRRSELAVRFSCVPSQISYVLETRFTPERGYAVETRRGGGGYVRILRLASQRSRAELARWLLEQAGSSLTAREAEALIARLEEAELLTAREAAVWRAVLRHHSQCVPEPLRNQVRGALLQGAMMVRFVHLLSAAEAGPPL